MTGLVEVKAPIVPVNEPSDTLFLMCTSYEDRCLGGVQQLSDAYRARHSVICRAAEYVDKGKSPAHYEKAKSILDKHSTNAPIELVFSIDDSNAIIQKLDAAFRTIWDASERSHITLDITTFPRQQLLTLLKFLDTRANRGTIRIIYSEPLQYATETPNPEDQWLSRGVTSVRTVPGFSGIQYPRRGKLLVVIEGHEGERTRITIRRHQPDKLILISQSSSQFHAGLDRIAGEQNASLAATYGNRVLLSATLPAHGIMETAREIEHIYSLYRHQYNLFIAPFGTKLQLLGTYIGVRELPAVQLVYASVSIYNWLRYSTGVGKLWQMDLGPVQSV